MITNILAVVGLRLKARPAYMQPTDKSTTGNRVRGLTAKTYSVFRGSDCCTDVSASNITPFGFRFAVKAMSSLVDARATALHCRYELMQMMALQQRRGISETK